MIGFAGEGYNLAPRTRSDRITIAGVKIWPRIGVTPGERRQAQACEVDVTLRGDFEAAATSDSLGRAIDYSKVIATVLEIGGKGEYNLVETLAYRIARGVLESCPAQSVSVRLRKRPQSLAGKVDYIEVEVEES